MQAAPNHLIPLLVIVPVIIWRMYSRIKRNIGRQTLGKWRPWVTLTLFPAILVLVSVRSIEHPAGLWSMAAGLAAGVLLGVFGTKHTKFENTPAEIFYTPNAHIGIALSVIFAARVVYRVFHSYSMDPNVPFDPADFASGPLTLSIFGLLAGYYMTYAVGLIRYRTGIARAAAAPTS